jgi:hypothetical protein
MAPRSRMRLVRARVSMPSRPGTLCSLSHEPSDLTWFQWHESAEYSETSIAVMCTALDSKKTGSPVSSVSSGGTP